MKYLLAVGLLLSVFLCGFAAEKTIYHIALQGATQVGGCKITHKATREEPYILTTCTYRCDRPVASTIDVKTDRENIICHKDEDSPPALGQNLEDH